MAFYSAGAGAGGRKSKQRSVLLLFLTVLSPAKYMLLFTSFFTTEVFLYLAHLLITSTKQIGFFFIFPFVVKNKLEKEKMF